MVNLNLRQKLHIARKQGARSAGVWRYTSSTVDTAVDEARGSFSRKF